MTCGRSVRVGAVALVLSAAIAGGVVSALPPGGGEPAAAAGGQGGSPSQSAPPTAIVSRKTLEQSAELGGTLGYAGAGSIINQLVGAVTGLPAEGALLKRNDDILEVNGSSRSVLLYGRRPAWRTLQRGVSNGRDVLQLEQNLRAMGYLPRSVTPDWHVDAATTAAVRRWQHARGVIRNGIVRLGQVVFMPGPVRITSVEPKLGSQVGPGATVAATTSATHIVTVALRADRQSLLSTGDKVTVVLPDGATTAGTVSAIGRVASGGDDGSPATVPVQVMLDDPSAAGTLDGAHVKVLVVGQRREDVLTVPVNALLALLEGGYAVEVADATGATHLVGVKLGLFQDSDVEVTGSLSAGDRVVVPA